MSTQEGSSSRRRVVLVENDAANRALMARVLRRRPRIELVAVPTGAGGLETARIEPPALVLLNSRLPDMPGNDVLDRLRSHPHTRDVPVIVVSADVLPEHVQAMLEAGAAAYLTKPFEVEQLLALIDRFVQPDDTTEQNQQ